MLRLLPALVFLAAVAGLSQASPAVYPVSTKTSTSAASHSRANKPAPGLSDIEIERTIRAKFAKSKISTDKFTVHVQGGVATLQGHTDVMQHKGVATRMAKTGGAIAVVNQIQISDAARAKAVANFEKGKRRAQVKHDTEARAQAH